MRKALYVDSDALETKISDSTVKIAELVDALGISRQAFDKKRKGITPFLVPEIFVISHMLHISDAESEKIFLPKV